MNKMTITIWGRQFKLDISYKVFQNMSVTTLQTEAADRFARIQSLNDSLEPVKKYVLEKDGQENGIKEIDNIFKYVMPVSVYIPQTKTRTVAILCNYKFDPEHGLAVVYTNEKFDHVDEEGMVL